MAKAKTAPLDLGAWCILRSASTDTLPLVKSLTNAGYNVWTPTERRTGRMPRTRTEYDKTFALMPSYAFADATAIDDLLKLAMVPNRKHPSFTIFQHDGGIPLIADTDLGGLREEEARCDAVYDRHKKKTTKGPHFDEGAIVGANSGGFEGLSGVVVGEAGQFTLVSFDGYHKPIKISSLLLHEDMASDEMPENGTAALTAMAR